MTIGEREALRPNPDFSPIFYLHYNPDVRGSGIPPFLHYIEIGHQEGRITKELPEILIDADQEMPPLPAGAVRRPRRPYALVAHIYYHDLWEEIAETIAAARPDCGPPGLDHRPRCGDRRARSPGSPPPSPRRAASASPTAAATSCPSCIS